MANDHPQPTPNPGANVPEPNTAHPVGEEAVTPTPAPTTVPDPNTAHPVGDDSAGGGWWKILLAILALLVVLGLVWWLISALGGDKDGDSSAAASSSVKPTDANGKTIDDRHLVDGNTPAVINDTVVLPHAEVTASNFRHIGATDHGDQLLCIDTNVKNLGDEPIILNGSDDWGLSTPDGENLTQQEGPQSEVSKGELPKSQGTKGTVCFTPSSAPDTTDYIVTFNKATNADGKKPTWSAAYNK